MNTIKTSKQNIKINSQVKAQQH
uniref:Uncharacterized protein n=1 Tax=Rhizophora mucronata TaxID=61149 RepID=A0A2P2KIQ4_RHIMU